MLLTFLGNVFIDLHWGHCCCSHFRILKQICKKSKTKCKMQVRTSSFSGALLLRNPSHFEQRKKNSLKNLIIQLSSRLLIQILHRGKNAWRCWFFFCQLPQLFSLCASRFSLSCFKKNLHIETFDLLLKDTFSLSLVALRTGPG